ncbi:alkane 1-monooxygenase [Histidinibacterium aquaticum]|uniref:Alkane 1-monooxygenase n=1 Tax=Histidinibacterium aquaticum TaxID=2613962 RepID=A0A5J5GRP6_9RHOB|nr:alkane 1-monooxygenase [Histidinibacterium aquaticum]KAA9010224.1 alkane 1-monooxygenase [Histidinibacterium aquaticum]
MRSPVPYFAVATLAPVALILAGGAWGGAWALAGLLWMTALAATLDEAVAAVLPEADAGAEFPSADWLSVALGLAHMAVLFGTVAALSSGRLAAWEGICLFLAAGLFLGQVSNSNAHELIHRGSRGLRRLGTAVYVTLFFGHHASAHPLVHHVHVATPRDPNSARLGESYWRFAPRAWIGSFRAGLAAESARMARAGRPAWRHPYLVYTAGGLAALLLSALIGGLGGMAAHMTLAGFAVSQLLMSDYVQHYGLTRRIGPDGKAEPVGAAHSWNSPHWFTSALMLNAPRHSDHHAHPSRPYPELALEPDAPRLPYSLPVMACLALSPRRWRRVMTPRAEALRGEAPVAAE